MDDLRSGLLGPYDAGAQGVVIWGSSNESNKPEFLTVRTYIQYNTEPDRMFLTSCPALNVHEHYKSCDLINTKGHVNSCVHVQGSCA